MKTRRTSNGQDKRKIGLLKSIENIITTMLNSVRLHILNLNNKFMNFLAVMMMMICGGTLM
jgi:uncharacterized membrane protein YqjE